MELYDIDTIYSFGKYKGKSLLDVSMENAMYIEWCLINVNSFAITEKAAEIIKIIYPKFLSKSNSDEILMEKILRYNRYEEKIAWEYENRDNHDERNKNRDDYYDDSLDLDQQSPEWWDSL